MDTDCAVRWDGDLRQIDKRVSYAIDQSDIQAKVEKEVEQVAKKKSSTCMGLEPTCFVSR